MDFVVIKNNGLGLINEKKIPNCCLFISLGIVWEIIKNDDFNFHINLFKQYMEREVTREEMVYGIMKVKYPELISPLGTMQIDTIIEKFVKYTDIKISVYLKESDMKFDLFKENEEPQALIIQHPNHFEAAIPKKYLK